MRVHFPWVELSEREGFTKRMAGLPADLRLGCAGLCCSHVCRRFERLAVQGQFILPAKGLLSALGDGERAFWDEFRNPARATVWSEHAERIDATADAARDIVGYNGAELYATVRSLLDSGIGTGHPTYALTSVRYAYNALSKWFRSKRHPESLFGTERIIRAELDCPENLAELKFQAAAFRYFESTPNPSFVYEEMAGTVENMAAEYKLVLTLLEPFAG